MKKGISLVVLVITIILLSILAGVVILNSDNIMLNTDKAKLQIDIAQIETLMDTYKMRKNGNIDFKTVRFDVSALSEQELEQFEGENIVNYEVELYVVDLKEIDASSSNFGNLKDGNKDRYLYSLVTGKVYYEKGLDADEMKYYYIKDGEF